LAALIPLFPLDVVLFPGTPLPLHIFEPRYKEMIGECLAQGLTFGVIRIVERQGLADVGCTAEIVTVVKEYPDGQLDIVTEGRRRFELVRVDQERSFLRAEVLMLEDEAARGMRKTRPGRFNYMLNCSRWRERSRISRRPIRRSCRFTWRDPSRWIWISSRNFYRRVRSRSGFRCSLPIWKS
jgi:Lon protease-like protein